MVDLTHIFGGAFTPPTPQRPDPPEVQLRDAIENAGLTPPAEIVLDGKVHRFRSGANGTASHGDKTGWYIAFGDNIPAGRFGCWRSGFDSTWRANIGREITLVEQMTHARRLSEAKALRDAESVKKQEAASITVETIWANSVPASDEHPYLKRKGVKANGSRATGDGRLVVPLFDIDGALSSLQYIDSEGGKLYQSGAQTGARFWILGALDVPGPLYVAEGFATAATIHEVSGRPCVVAYSASNLVPVTGLMRELYGKTQDIVIVADNDASGVGRRYGEQASAKHGARLIMPPELGDANDYQQAGGDLALLLCPVNDDWMVKGIDFRRQPAPISWLVKKWLQSNALIMVHGPSGGGKTFVVLDWCLRIASSVPDWAGHKVKPGTVVYLAGEGHHGMRSRLAAWHTDHVDVDANIWLSRSGCDLNTAEGYRRVVDAVRALPSIPSLIVVDTLHRFLSGDENSAQDAKTMLDACGALMQEFGCSVLLVHHTGVSDEAQHRARGSSAWRGALDIEISIVPGKDGQPMEIVQRKSKDAEIAEPVYAELKSVEIPGWLDEDGEQVKSAVVEICAEAPVKPERKKESKVEGFRKQFENAWWESGAEELDGLPYVSRSAMRLILEKMGKTARTIENDIAPSYNDKLIGSLILAEIIRKTEHGWVVCNEVNASALLMRKKSYNSIS